jgi:uncharacterized Zn finger protein
MAAQPNAPVCSTCATEQSGIVLFLWSGGAVVYECRHCGTFNEVSEVRAAKRPVANSIAPISRHT